MAGSKYAYVRKFELPDTLLPGTFMVFRLDGHSFHRFSEVHNFEKPNDCRALQLMDQAARGVMEEYPDITLAFGESDEFSFLLRKSTALYNRRESKIVSTLTSLFTSCYVFHWPQYFPDIPLRYPPFFDGRIVLYPSAREVRDYFSWRQADTHINNLYNTTFWALVQQGGQTAAEAHGTLKGTMSNQKQEILFSRFNINYNHVSVRYRKGSIVIRQEVSDQASEIACGAVPAGGADHPAPTATYPETSPKGRIEVRSTRKEMQKMKIDVLHCDIIKDEFWSARPELLET
ncbi:Thg1 C terminal domain-containing protein [Infundibulicybe gibba]|nr:Thg1 C terminal domain-containing protein [Infundibulicybe gibba]